MIEDFDLQIFAYCPVMRSSEKNRLSFVTFPLCGSRKDMSDEESGTRRGMGILDALGDGG